MNEDQKSNALMSSLYYHASAGWISETNEEKRNQLGANSVNAMRQIKLNGGETGPGTIETGKGFLSLFQNRFGKE